MYRVLLIALISALALSFPVNKDNIDAAFKFSKFMVDFEKSYASTAEYDHAFDNFKLALGRIAAAEKRGYFGYGITKFSDLNPAEFRQQYLLPKGAVAANLKNMNFKVNDSPSSGALPDKFDWRDQNAVTPVKDQQQSGSCWAFSTTENFESMTFLTTKDLPVLGPQQLVDCDPQSQGCGGGWTYWAFEYLLTAGGQETEVDYPYTAMNGNCAFDASKIAARISNFTFATKTCQSASCPVQDDLLRTQLTNIGPVSICVNAEIWSDWSGPAPLPASECPGAGDELDHCVQLVGYNWPLNYWIVRNSWNTNWGQEGYIYLQTGKNTCGLADVVTYANTPSTDHHKKH